MRYLPHTSEEIAEMLAVVGKNDLDGLFADIPEDCRFSGDIPISPALTEWQLNDRVREIAASMAVGPEHAVLVGAGRYYHHTPETIRALISRSEFLTAYTPYQPEMAQGTLQGIFEYQTLTARLLGMAVANASLYDGGSALAEALLMGLRVVKKSHRVAISSAVHPHYRAVARTYLQSAGFELVELPCGPDGRTDFSSLQDIRELAAVAVQTPNFFGIVEDLEAAGTAIHAVGALFVSSFTEPLAFGLLKNPGQCGADIACGEGQSFGMAPSFGGAGLGMFACREEFVRNMPGRLVGETVDLEGRRGFVLTLSTREQHIRREKATSNICSNQGLCAMTAAMYMASLGGGGIRELARLNYDKTEYLKAELSRAGGSLVFQAPTFNEFVMRFDRDFVPIRQRLLAKKIVAGLDLGGYYPELSGCVLFGVTETIGREIMDEVVREVSR